MDIIAIAGLIRIDMPDATVVRLCTGGSVKWGSDIYTACHDTYGAIGSFDGTSEGIGNEVPAAQLVLQPPGTTAAADLVAPGAQTARVRCWVVEIDRATYQVSYAPPPLWDGFLDQARLVRGPGQFDLELAVVSFLERLFEGNTGNGLNSRQHKAVWPGETGEDGATGLVLQDAWGVEAPPQGGTAALGRGSANYWGRNVAA